MGLVVAVIGGGAAGFFSAIAAASNAQVVLLEKTNQVLSKVRVSGGGRCNVTHNCHDPHTLAQHYPRGAKELIGPLHRFGPRETVRWFKERGIPLVAESDGRMFPVTNTSESVVRGLSQAASQAGVEVRRLIRIEELHPDSEGFRIRGPELDLVADSLILATGSGRKGHQWAEALGHTIQRPVPSLFTFTIADFELSDVAGAVASEATISIAHSAISQSGPLLITHWGFSGPAALKLSSWGARELHARQYKTKLLIDWTGGNSFVWGSKHKQIGNQPQYNLPKRLWRRLLLRVNVPPERPLNRFSQTELNRLMSYLQCDTYSMIGKTTHKEEFVTCGGVTLSEVDFRNMESRICPGLHFAGEILDIDGVTGGFNFQSAWTTGFLAGNAI